MDFSAPSILPPRFQGPSKASTLLSIKILIVSCGKNENKPKKPGLAHYFNKKLSKMSRIILLNFCPIGEILANLVTLVKQFFSSFCCCFLFFSGNMKSDIQVKQSRRRRHHCWRLSQTHLMLQPSWTNLPKQIGHWLWYDTRRLLVDSNLIHLLKTQNYE